MDDIRCWQCFQKLVKNQVLSEGECLTFLGRLHADTPIAIKAGRAAAADIADMRRPAVDALHARKAGPAGTRGRQIHGRRPIRS